MAVQIALVFFRVLLGFVVVQEEASRADLEAGFCRRDEMDVRNPLDPEDAQQPDDLLVPERAFVVFIFVVQMKTHEGAAVFLLGYLQGIRDLVFKARAPGKIAGGFAAHFDVQLFLPVLHGTRERFHLVFDRVDVNPGPAFYGLGADVKRLVFVVVPEDGGLGEHGERYAGSLFDVLSLSLDIAFQIHESVKVELLLPQCPPADFFVRIRLGVGVSRCKLPVRIRADLIRRGREAERGQKHSDEREPCENTLFHSAAPPFRGSPVIFFISIISDAPREYKTFNCFFRAAVRFPAFFRREKSSASCNRRRDVL